MRTKTNRVGRHLARVATALLSIGFVACGGGGGGGGDGGSAGGVPYNGRATPAAIDDTNAPAIAADAVTTVGSTNTGVLARQSNQRRSMAGVSAVGQIILDVLNGKDVSRDAARGEALVPVSDSISGTCGGAVSVGGSVDDQTAVFSLTLDFDRYCDSGITMGGQVDASGSVVGLFSMDITMTGSRLAFRDNSDDRTFLWEDFRFTFNAGGSDQEYTIDGRFYHPDHGYVLVTTLSSLRVVEPNAFPSSGSITVVEDQANADSATLTAISASQYRVDIDNGNDGTVEASTIHNWGDSN